MVTSNQPVFLYYEVVSIIPKKDISKWIVTC